MSTPACCAALQSTVSGIGECCGEKTGIVELAENPAIIVTVYMVAFFTWGVVSSLDFITEKWRSVKDTRRLGLMHLLASFIPMLYVGFYAYLQALDGDYKEMMAAILAIMLSLYHVARTAFGMMQLQAFRDWCAELAECTKVMKEPGDKTEDEDGDSEEDFDEKLMANNTVVDNEFEGTDLDVKLSTKKILAAFMRRETGSLKPSNWLWTDSELLCTVRWSGAYLCAFGEEWRGTHGKKMLEELFDGEDHLTLLQVTMPYDGKMLSFFESLHSSLLGASYGGWYKHYFAFLPEEYAFEFNNLLSSYPTTDKEQKNNRNNSIVEFVYCIMMAKHFGPKGITSIRDQYLSRQFPSMQVWNDSLRSFHMQCAPLQTSGTLASVMGLPFLWRVWMIPLWDTCTNWRVQQASVHADNSFSLSVGGIEYTQHGSTTVEENEFTHFRDTANDLLDHPDSEDEYLFIGCVLETVRSLLAKWIHNNAEKLHMKSQLWEPLLPTETTLEFGISGYVSEKILSEEDTYHSTDEFRPFTRRFIWELQFELQSRLARQFSDHPDLPASLDLILLFLLGFPVLHVRFIEADTQKDDVQENKAFTQTEKQILRIEPVWRPQQISICAEIDCDLQKAVLRLECAGVNARFNWESWINTAMGAMKGFDDNMWSKCQKRQGSLRYRKRHIHMADLRRSLTQFSPPHELLSNLPGEISVWNGWPLFDVNICLFEMNQWMTACGLDTTKSWRDRSETQEAFDEQVVFAKNNLTKIMSWNRL